MSFNTVITNIYFWMGLSFLFLLLFALLLFILILLAKKTHAIKEFKAWRKKIPICQFYDDTGHVEWVPIKPEAGTVHHKDYGTFVVNEEGKYIDRTTNNIMLPFDSQFSPSVNLAAVKVSEDLLHLIDNKEKLGMLRAGLMSGEVEVDESLVGLKTSVRIGNLKKYMNAIIPHNINAAINMKIAKSLKSYGKIDTMQIMLVFAAILGAIVMGYILVKTVGR